MPLVTRSGRQIDAPPAIRLTTLRKATLGVLKVDAWLLREAVTEAAARQDVWNLQQFAGYQASRLTSADKAELNLYLFGTEEVYS